MVTIDTQPQYGRATYCLDCSTWTTDAMVDCCIHCGGKTNTYGVYKRSWVNLFSLLGVNIGYWKSSLYKKAA